MPIVFISPDCMNTKLNEIHNLIDEFDYVYSGTSEACTNMSDFIYNSIFCEHVFSTYLLDIENCSRQNYNHVMNQFSIETGNVLIIAEKSYFNTLKKDWISEEWDTLPLKEKFISKLI